MKKLTKIAITMGEPGGVGPEVIAKALNVPAVKRCCIPVVIGNADVMNEAVNLAGISLKVRSITSMSEVVPSAGTVYVLDIRSRLSAKKGISSISAGRAIVKYIRKAVGLALAGSVDAIVTAPISKESLKLAGHKWPGHTELLAELTDTKNFAMMFSSEKLKVTLCTIHIPLKDVSGKIKKALVLRTIRHAEKGALMFGNKLPRIAVAGLNPHAGEAGIMGRRRSDRSSLQ